MDLFLKDGWWRREMSYALRANSFLKCPPVRYGPFLLDLTTPYLGYSELAVSLE
jgi:hypothetical protein